MIPARYESVRLPGKLLLPIAEKAIVVHTAERAAIAEGVSSVIVATDDERIVRVVAEAGYNVKLTSREHESGTDRVAEVAAEFDPETIIVNVQADEPLIDPNLISSVAECLANNLEIDIATAYESISDIESVFDPNVVKVVEEAGIALYFSRSPVPFQRDGAMKHGGLREFLEADPGALKVFKKHLGIYAFRNSFLQKFAKSRPSRIEFEEKLEQLRALALGARIGIVASESVSIGVDTPEDYEKVRAIMEI
ncbi:MAG: 3-deoxy-manno-octulosonate cytidylyltransferase [Pyrinomonadaceae bacterium]